jgi:hypothetical protein
LITIADATGCIAIASRVARIASEIAPAVAASEGAIRTAAGIAGATAQILRLSRAAVTHAQEIAHLTVRRPGRLIFAPADVRLLRTRRACSIRVKGPRAAALRLSAY